MQISRYWYLKEPFQSHQKTTTCYTVSVIYQHHFTSLYFNLQQRMVWYGMVRSLAQGTVTSILPRTSHHPSIHSPASNSMPITSYTNQMSHRVILPRLPVSLQSPPSGVRIDGETVSAPTVAQTLRNNSATLFPLFPITPDFAY